MRIVIASAIANGARPRALAAGDRLPFGSASLHVWNPRPTPRARSPTRNDESLVLDVRLGEVSLLLPGDIGATVERGLASELDADADADVRLCVLAAPHHGSRSSSSGAFLDAFAPRIVLISAGLNNRHGHPAPATLERYRARGIEVFRTDLDGAIQLLTDGHAVKVVTCTGRLAQAGSAPGRPFSTTKEASVSMGAPGRETKGTTR
jgi:competence protein ComEC